MGSIPILLISKCLDMLDSSKWLGGPPLTRTIAGSNPLSSTNIGVWAKGEPPVLGTGYQVGSIPTTPAMVGKPASAKLPSFPCQRNFDFVTKL